MQTRLRPFRRPTPIGKFGGSFAVDVRGRPRATSRRRRRSSGRACRRRRSTRRSSATRGRREAGPNTARQVSHRAGVPDSVPAYTVNKACASSLKAMTLGALSIAAGENDVVLAGGAECMSATPYLLPRARFGYRMGHAEIVDGMYRDGFLCPLCGQLMGETAEKLAREYGILRAEQDAYAVESQRRAAQAIASGRFADEIAPVEIAGRKGSVAVEKDEHPRPDTTLEALAKLPAGLRPGERHGPRGQLLGDHRRRRGARARDRRGGAQGRSRAARARRGLDLGRRGPGAHGDRAGPGDPGAARRRRGASSRTIDLIELNEAFAAQVIACARELPLDLARVNVNGGAIALGHPIGATGARIATTLLHEMKKRGTRLGLATLCVSGGMGMAVLFERD